MYTLSGKFQTNYLIIDRHQEKKSTLQKGIGDDRSWMPNEYTRTVEDHNAIDFDTPKCFRKHYILTARVSTKV